MRSLWGVFFALAVWAGVSEVCVNTAWAQPQPASASPALEAFRRGTQALSERRYDVAVREFEESCRLGCAPVARYNLGIAYQNLGTVRAAVASFERYLTTETRFPDPGREPAVRRTLVELRARLATVALAVTPTTFTLSIDGEAATPTDGAVTLDPGDHTLSVSAPGYVTWHESVQLSEGQRVERAVTLTRELVAVVSTTPRAVTAPVGETPARRPTVTPDAPFYTRWWFWTGVAVVAVGAGVTGVVVANENATLEPLPSGATFTVMTVRVE